MSETERGISTHSHNLVVDSDGNAILNENGKFLVARISDGSLEAVAPEIIQNVFGISLSSLEEYNVPSPRPSVSGYDVPSAMETNNETAMHVQNDADRMTWNRSHILKLIHLYKEHINLFRNTAVRNERVWGMIAKEMAGYSVEQCKNKFKYLKGKYMKKKDNMSMKATGENFIKFEYLEEFDDIFKNDPNVAPISIASSSKEVQQETTDLDVEDSEVAIEKENHKRRKPIQNKENINYKHKLTVAGQLNKIAQEINEREKNRERRHKEILEQRERMISVLTSMIEKHNAN